MQQLVLTVHVLVSIAIVALVLVQNGRGADMSASFGSSGSNTMFGSQGNMSFLMKLTALLGFLFFITSFGLSFMASKASHKSTAFAKQIRTNEFLLPHRGERK